MKNKFLLQRLVIIPLGLVAASITFVGCGMLTPEDKEAQLKDIKEIATEIDYKSAGRILEEKYKPASSKLESSSLTVSLEGEEPFAQLKESILKLDGIDCVPVNAEAKTISCRLNVISVNATVREEDTEKPYTDLIIIDPKSGRGK